MGTRNNSTLHTAKSSKNDEYFTSMESIEEEVRHYRSELEGKTIYCNCDNPFISNFFKYFAREFGTLKLKSLICTNYASGNYSFESFKKNDNFANIPAEYFTKACKITINNRIPDLDGDGYVTINDVELFLRNDVESGAPKYISFLDGDGDFRSSECVSILEEADVIITNPPFSLFREYIHLMESYSKQYLIIGNKNAITYKEVFPLIKNDRLWLGYSVPRDFIQPDGDLFKSVNGLTKWFTNLDVSKRHTNMYLHREYSPEEYPQYDNYVAINVDKVEDIPKNYVGVMGVPITFLDRYNPDQFKIIWTTDRGGEGRLDYLKKDYPTYGTSYLNGNAIYKRIFIQNKNPEIISE